MLSYVYSDKIYNHSVLRFFALVHNMSQVVKLWGVYTHIIYLMLTSCCSNN